LELAAQKNSKLAHLKLFQEPLLAGSGSIPSLLQSVDCTYNALTQLDVSAQLTG
jgi:hypothetical protein